MPLRVHRFLLLLRYLEYLVDLYHHLYAYLALESSPSIMQEKHRGTETLSRQVSGSHLNLDARNLSVLADAKRITVYASEVEKLAEK